MADPQRVRRLFYDPENDVHEEAVDRFISNCFISVFQSKKVSKGDMSCIYIYASVRILSETSESEEQFKQRRLFLGVLSDTREEK